MRWQLWPYPGNGYNMKNAISNGGSFQLAARLALYTSNSTYAEWAQKAWDWSVSSPFVDKKTWNVVDSTVNDDGYKYTTRAILSGPTTMERTWCCVHVYFIPRKQNG
jgi:mannan endo-1,6-alpha-mannosidase